MLARSISAVLGDRGPEAGDSAGMTAEAFDLRVFPGDHFSLVSRRSALIGHLLGR